MSNLSELLPSGGGQNLVEFVASGTLPSGKPVVLKSDGTVTLVGFYGSPVAENIPAGSATVYNAGNTLTTAVAFDPNTAGRFVVTYRDNGANNYGMAVVGTVSGTSMTFGTEVAFNSGNTYETAIAFDPDTANKFVVMYSNGSGGNTGKASVGTISGTSITFGTGVVFNSSETTQISMAFDSANKCVLTYKDNGNSNYGTAIIGTVSGTSISFGSEVVFVTSAATSTSVKCDPNNSNKFIVAYREGASPFYGKVNVGTISGTSISFGSAVVFNAGNTSNISLSFDSNTLGKFVITYNDSSNSQYGTAIVGTVSGTSASFGSEYVFNSGSTYFNSASFDPLQPNKFVVAYTNWGATAALTAIVGTVSGTTLSFGSPSVFSALASSGIALSFDSNTPGKFVVSYPDAGNSGYGTARLGQLAATLTNLTATNLIGITSEATSSGGTAKINTWGGINEAQTSLTIASDYYAQTDGTITTATAGQKLGTAISATTINMKDLT